jgi:hypothetical protein
LYYDFFIKIIPKNLKLFIYFLAELFAEQEDIEEQPIPENQTVSNSCPFMEDIHSGSEWAYNAPVLLILACNMLILIYIMTVRKLILNRK